MRLKPRSIESEDDGANKKLNDADDEEILAIWLFLMFHLKNK